MIAYIPARAGSKRVKNKNRKELGDLPLICHSILQANYSKLIDKVLVSSDSERILKLSESLGAEIVKRSELASNDTAQLEDGIIEAIDKRSIWPDDDIIILQPTSPLRYIEQIDAAIEQYRREGYYSAGLMAHKTCLVSVYRSPNKLMWDAKSSRPCYDTKNRPRSQELGYSLVENGSIYICKASDLVEAKSRITGNATLFEMNEPGNNIDIDTEEDFRAAEYLAEEYFENGYTNS